MPMKKPTHIINENKLGYIGISDDKSTFLVAFKQYHWSFSDKGIACFKHYLFNHASEFHWFHTLLDIKAYIRIDSLSVQLVLTREEIEELKRLLIETKLIIESRLLVLPAHKSVKK